MLLKWTSAAGDEIQFIDPYRLRDIEGIGLPPAAINLQKAPYQDGKTFIEEVIFERVIDIQCRIGSINHETLFQRRKTLNEALSQKLGIGTLEYDCGETYDIKCVPSGVEYPGGNARSPYHQLAMISLVAPDPFWYQGEETETLIEGPQTITNAGDITPVTIEITDCQDPKITNETTGKFIELDLTIGATETLTINTKYGERSVLLDDGVNIINHFPDLVQDSEFWQLVTGDNIIRLEATSATPTATLKYKTRHLGI